MSALTVETTQVDVTHSDPEAGQKRTKKVGERTKPIQKTAKPTRKPADAEKNGLNSALHPFTSEAQLSCFQWLKVLIMTVTLAPIKFCMVMTTLIVMWAISCVGSCCLGDQRLDSVKLSRCRKCLQHCVFGLARVLCFWLGIFCLRVKGTPTASKHAPIIVCAPHSTMMDVIVAASLRSSPVAKSALQHTPIWGKILTFIQTVYVDRDDPVQRREALALMQLRTEKAATEKGWWRLCVFPEGTTTNAKVLIPFKRGAFSTTYPVLPVLLTVRGEPDIYRWTWRRSFGDWSTIWLMLCQVYIDMQVEYLPAYVPTGAEIINPDLYAENVRRLMAKKLKIGLSDKTYADAKKLAESTQED